MINCSSVHTIYKQMDSTHWLLSFIHRDCIMITEESDTL